MKTIFEQWGLLGNETTIRILVVDDFEDFRRYVNSLLHGQPEVQVIGTASDGLEAVVLEAARRIRERVPETNIVFLTQEPDPDVVKEAVSFGALGYVVKLQASRDLLAALAAVREGRRFVSEGLVGD